jgi:adenine-specific DNA-methyltransferase
VIVISIDDNEFAGLRNIMDDTFGEEAHLASFIWKRRQQSDNRNATKISVDHEYLVFYARSSFSSIQGRPIDQNKYQNPDNDQRGPWTSDNLTGLATAAQRPNLHFDIVDPTTGIAYPPSPNRGWSKNKESIDRLIQEGKILFPKSPDGRPRQKKFLNELLSMQTGFSTWLPQDQVGYTTDGTREVSELFGFKAFDFPKPTTLLALLVKQIADSDSIVLDFFAGSGTTAQAVLELNEEDGGNRQFILVQMPEPTPDDSEARKAGFANIAEITKERVRRVIKKIEKEKGGLTDRDRGFRVFKLAETGFQQWADYKGGSLEEYDKQLLLHMAETGGKAKEEDLVVEIMLREGFPLDSRIEKIEEGALEVRRIESDASAHRLFICLDAGFGRSLTVRTFEKLQVRAEDVFVCRDDSLSDEAKLRIRELCKLATV